MPTNTVTPISQMTGSVTIATSPVTGSNLCLGPLGVSSVLPLRTMVWPAGSSCTSLCNGSTMHQLWFVHNNVIATQATSYNAFSWIFVADFNPAPYLTPGTLFTPPKPRLIIPKAVRAGRRAVRRSIDLYTRFRGMEEVRRFLRGEELVYHGAQHDYAVRKKQSVLAQAMRPNSPHIPYTLWLRDKHTGRNLASGCVVFPSLPIFDQLLALALHIQDPDEEIKLMNTTNWSPRLMMDVRQAA